MSKRIRRTITITIMETWTFVWTPDDTPPGHPVTFIPHPPETEEEANENLQADLTVPAPDKLGGRNPPASPLTTGAALDLLPVTTPSHGAIDRKRKRARRWPRNDP